MLDRLCIQACTWLLSSRGQAISVLALLATHTGLLAYSATRHSPTHLEPAFLAAGITNWQLGRFELYRVNPPLVQMVAALPVLAVGCETDWTRFCDGPGSRAEFPVGEDFVKANGPRSIRLFFYARWACVPLSLIGAFFAYRWARELYGSAAALVTLILYVFEPNLLAHGELITPDGACTAFGILAGYTFWRWLKRPTWISAGLAGGALGLAELSKMSWLILFGLWPLLWMVWRWLEVRNIESAVLRIQGLSPGESPTCSTAGRRVSNRSLSPLRGMLKSTQLPPVEVVSSQETTLKLSVVSSTHGDEVLPLDGRNALVVAEIPASAAEHCVSREGRFRASAEVALVASRWEIAPAVITMPTRILDTVIVVSSPNEPLDPKGEWTFLSDDPDLTVRLKQTSQFSSKTARLEIHLQANDVFDGTAGIELTQNKSPKLRFRVRRFQ